MSNLKRPKKISFIIHPILFSIYPIIFIFSENINLLPVTEIILPISIIVGITILMLFILKIVNHLKFSKITLSQDLRNAAKLILADKKHLDNNPRVVTEEDVIILLEEINNQ